METQPKPENLSFDDWSKFDIRAGRVLSVEVVPKSKKLLKLEVSFGPVIGNRTIVAGIAQATAYGKVIDGVWHDSALEGAGIVAVLNLAPRALAGITSHGMLLALRLDPIGADLTGGELFLVSPGPARGGEEVG
jgi:methionine--tRNA ligase beta chain